MYAFKDIQVQLQLVYADQQIAATAYKRYATLEFYTKIINN